MGPPLGSQRGTLGADHPCMGCKVDSPRKNSWVFLAQGLLLQPQSSQHGRGCSGAAGWKDLGEVVPNYSQTTPLAEPVQTAAWIPHSDVLCRKVRRVFLHHVSDPDEEEGAMTISSIYGYRETGSSPPVLLSSTQHTTKGHGTVNPVPPQNAKWKRQTNQPVTNWVFPTSFHLSSDSGYVPTPASHTLLPCHCRTRNTSPVSSQVAETLKMY